MEKENNQQPQPKQPLSKDRYILDPKDGRACFNVYKEVFSDKKKKAIERLERSSENGFRSLLYREVYEDNVLFLFLFQTVKHSESVILSKTHPIDNEEKLKFFKKIKNICNPENIFEKLSMHEER